MNISKYVFNYSKNITFVIIFIMKYSKIINIFRTLILKYIFSKYFLKRCKDLKKLFLDNSKQFHC